MWHLSFGIKIIFYSFFSHINILHLLFNDIDYFVLEDIPLPPNLLVSSLAFDCYS